MKSADLNVLSNFGLRHPYKFAIYISTLIFMGSLFIPMQSIDVAMVRIKTIQIILWGLLTWLIMKVLDDAEVPVFICHGVSFIYFIIILAIVR